MKHDLLIFDADETLYDFKKAERGALKETCEAYGLTYVEADHLPLYQKINTALWDALERGEIDRTSLKRERFAQFLSTMGADHDPVAFGKLYMERLSYGSYVYADSLPLIEKLKPHVRLLIITNGLTVVHKEADSPV